MKTPASEETALDGDSLYLTAAGVVVPALSALSLNNQFQKWMKRRRGRARSPMWASELYQIIALTIGLLIVAVLPSVRRGPVLLERGAVALAIYRIVEIALFALQWLIVDRRPVKNFRRSLIAFTLNLVELSIFATVVVFAESESWVGDQWAMLYRMTSSVFAQSVPVKVDGPPYLRIFEHVVVVEAWLLVLVVLAAVINGVTREDLSSSGLSVPNTDTERVS